MKLGLAFHKFSPKGFTLIELLIVIAILGVLAAGVLVAIDPVDKINQANDAKVQNDVSNVGKASEAYATVHNGFYPAALSDLVTAGELKREPKPPSGYDVGFDPPFGSLYWVGNTPTGCTAGTTCTAIAIGGELKSKKYKNASPILYYWKYESSTGKSCPVQNLVSGLPGSSCP